VTRKDTRRCASPMCGGVFVKRVNQALTRCADGSDQAECYVYGVDLSALLLTDALATNVDTKFTEKHAIVRADARYTTFNGQRIGKLKVKEAWLGAGEIDVESNVYRVADSGIRCITTPCNVVQASTLNSRDAMPINSVTLGSVGSSQERSKARAAIMTAKGVLVAGSIATPKCMANATNCGPWITAEEFYLPVTANAVVPAPSAQLCGGLAGIACPTGQFCSYKAGDFCGAADAMGTCASRPQVCTMIYAPVCGCDDKTYSSSCVAASAGISVSSNGACRK
jgi:hypothetical protein